MMGQFLDMVLPEMGNHVNGLIHMDMLVWQINISSKVSLKNIIGQAVWLFMELVPKRLVYNLDNTEKSMRMTIKQRGDEEMLELPEAFTVARQLR